VTPGLPSAAWQLTWNNASISAAPCGGIPADEKDRPTVGSAVSAATGTVLVFKTETYSSSLLFGFTMLYDVISAVAEFMVRVLQLPPAIGIHDVV
jgi:hypothetical protein